MLPVSRTIDRFDATFDHDGLIANAGLIIIATLMSRLGLEQLANKWVHTGSFAPGRKICTLIAAMVAGATHIDHVDVLRAGATQTVLPFKVMAPSTIGTSFFAHVQVRVRPPTRRGLLTVVDQRLGRRCRAWQHRHGDRLGLHDL